MTSQSSVTVKDQPLRISATPQPVRISEKKKKQTTAQTLKSVEIRFIPNLPIQIASKRPNIDGKKPSSKWPFSYEYPLNPSTKTRYTTYLH